MYISVGTMGIKWLGSPTVGCTTVDLTFNYYRFTSPNTCVGFDVTVNSQPLDWYIYGVTFVDPVTLDEFFIIQCDATYPRPITRPAPTCFLVRRPDGTYDIYKDYMVYYYGAVDTHNTSSCGEAISRLGASSALGGRFSWNISGDHDQICFYWSAPHEDGSQRKVCIPWVAKWWETELPLNVDGYTIEDISDCVTLPPPCEPYLCFPSCLVKSCDSVVNPSALFLDVESLNGCCLDGSYEFTWDSGTNHYYSGKIGDPFLVTCGYVEIWYECSGSTFRRRVKITDINGNVSDTTQNAPGGCSGSPQNFHDTFDVTSFIGLPLCANESPFFSDTVTFVIQTNN
jgi:hypothetical protein